MSVVNKNCCFNDDYFSFQIITQGGVTYKNEPWHRECFTCTHCSTSLAGQRFTSRDDKPYCAECFGELFAKRCTSCTKPITGNCTQLLDHIWILCSQNWPDWWNVLFQASVALASSLSKIAIGITTASSAQAAKLLSSAGASLLMRKTSSAPSAPSRNSFKSVEYEPIYQQLEKILLSMIKSFILFI